MAVILLRAKLNPLVDPQYLPDRDPGSDQLPTLDSDLILESWLVGNQLGLNSI